MTSQAQAIEPLPRVHGLVFFSFPFSEADNLSVDRGDHLSAVFIPMLFLQGTKDALADIGLLEDVVGDLNDRATLIRFQEADHNFRALRSHQTDRRVMEDMLDHTVAWIRENLPPSDL